MIQQAEDGSDVPTPHPGDTSGVDRVIGLATRAGISIVVARPS